MSAIQGSYTPEQTFLDMSAGARTTTSLYDDEVPTDLRLAPDGRMSSWQAIAERAGTAPADVVPGLLASSVREAGGHVGYAGPRTSRNREAAVAADRSGRVERVALVRPGGGRARRARPVARYQCAGREAAARAARARTARASSSRRVRPADLVLVIQDPSHITRRLVATGAAGLRGGTTLYSDSTRTEGLVSSTDVAPTVLERLDVAVPDDMTGQPIEARGDASPADLSELRNRLTDLGPRRWAVIWLGLIGAVAIAGIAGLARRDPRLPGRVAPAGRDVAPERAAADRRARSIRSGRGGDRRRRVRGARPR